MTTRCIITQRHDDGYTDSFATNWPNHTPAQAYTAQLSRLRPSPRFVDTDPHTLTIRTRDRMSDDTSYTTTIRFVGDDDQDTLPDGAA